MFRFTSNWAYNVSEYEGDKRSLRQTYRVHVILCFVWGPLNVFWKKLCWRFHAS